MKSDVLLLMLACLAAFDIQLALAEHSSYHDWLQYKRQYGKVYEAPEEDARRFSLFLATKERIGQHNSNPDQTSYKMGLNHMSDWTSKESASLYGLQYDLISHKKRFEAEAEGHPMLKKIRDDPFPVPDQLDWRRVPNVVSPVVGDQGNCASSYAFATAGVLEGQQVRLNFTRELIPLSVQQIVDCSRQNYGCDSGGLMEPALIDLAEMGGIESEKDYPYVANMSTGCSFNKSKPIVMTNAGAVDLVFDTVLIKKLIAKLGPISAGVSASENFQHYKSDVFIDTTCDGNMNLAVLIVGYGFDETVGDYWILKNAFSSSWGESGYMRIKFGVCNLGSIATVATYLR